jgi:hypothetical protein
VIREPKNAPPSLGDIRVRGRATLSASATVLLSTIASAVSSYIAVHEPYLAVHEWFLSLIFVGLARLSAGS